MFLFGMAKANLLAQFKARFNFNVDRQVYTFYPDPGSDGFLCDQNHYENFVIDFKKTLKWGTRVLWFSLLAIIPLLLYIQWQAQFEWTFLTAAPFLAMPLPFVFARGYKSFTAPNRFFKELRFTGKVDRVRKLKGAKQNVIETRIKGMSWAMLVTMPIISVIGAAIYSPKAERVNAELIGVLFLFALVFCFGCYLIVKKLKIRHNEYELSE